MQIEDLFLQTWSHIVCIAELHAPRPLIIIKHPKSMSVSPGTEVTFSCEAIGHDYDNIFVATC